MAISRTDVVVELPRPLTSLIGRERELDHLYKLLKSDAALVTITGFGGIGKTRLSLQAALELEPIFDAGAIFVPLASVTRARSIPRAIALTAGLDESIDTVRALSEALGPSSRLLVLDNLEQIPDAAEMVLELLQTMPHSTILATSRTRLELSAEYILPLDPLETQSGDARSLPSVQLFIERGKAISPSLPTDDEAIAIITEICQKLDGIPLAIELATARLPIFSLSDLRDQLKNLLPVLASSQADLPDRQRTMRNTIAWTFELLGEPERRLFAWLSVYEQDFSLDSIRHVAHQLELTDHPLDLVQFLVNRSLIRPSRREGGSPRYQMLQMLREFGHEQLRATNEDHLARRSHANDMVALAERAEPLLITSESGTVTRDLNQDIPNLYAALAWSKAQEIHSITQRIFAALWRYFENTGQVNRVLEYEPDTSEGTADDTTRARALVGIGYLYEKDRDLPASLDAFNKAVELARTLPDQVVLVRALTGLGTVYFDYSDVPLAQQYLNEASQLAARIGDTKGELTSTGMLGIINIQLGNLETAIATFAQLTKLIKGSGDLSSLASLHMNTSLCYQSLSRFEDAQTSLLKALAVAEEAGDIATVCNAYANLSGNAIKTGNLEESLEYGEKGLKIAREIGMKLSEATLLTNLAAVKHQQNDIGAGAALVAQASALMDFEGGAKEQIHFASVISQFSLEAGLLMEAAELLGAVITMRENLQIPNRDVRANAEDEILATLNPDENPAHAEAMARGAAFDRSELVERIKQAAEAIIAKRPPGSAIPENRTPEVSPLTPREIEVISMVAKGLTNAEIAEEMFVSTRTITTHLTNIFTKLEVNNRSRAIAVAAELGLV